MQLKDIVIIVISSLALLVSVSSVAYTIFWGRHEYKRALRILLTDTIKEISSTEVEIIKLKSDKKNADAVDALKDRYYVLLEQALYLADKVKSMVTPIEYITLGIGCTETGRTADAEKYYLSAIAGSKHDLYKAESIKCYGHYLYKIGRNLEGKKQYEKALGLLEKTDTNQSHLIRARYYIKWAHDLRKYSPTPEKANKEFTNAETEINRMTVQAQKQGALNDLQNARKADSVPVQQPLAETRQTSTLLS